MTNIAKRYAIVFSTDEKYLCYLEVCLLSLITHLKKINRYDFIVLHKKLHKTKIRSFVKRFKNIKIKFIDIDDYLNNICQTELYIEIHVTESTYYRFLIPTICKSYSKVLYLDCDLIFLDNIDCLFDEINMTGFEIAACIDNRERIAFYQRHIVSNRYWNDYIINTLKLDFPDRYFQAGVILFNIQECINSNLEKRLFDKIKVIKDPILSDQDILNATIKHNYVAINTRFNIEWQILFEFENWEECVDFEFLEALKNPAIIHYASSKKPWFFKSFPFSDIWWKYARKTDKYHLFQIYYFAAVIKRFIKSIIKNKTFNR